MVYKTTQNTQVFRFWLPMLITGFWALYSWGCATSKHFDMAVLDEYESQKRIVRQGLIEVPVPEGKWEAIFFGYDRNHDYNSQILREKGRGVDLLEYKRILPGGHWEFPPFLILLDANYDGYVDWVCLDYDRDTILDAVYAPAPATLHFDRIDFRLFKPFAYEPLNE